MKRFIAIILTATFLLTATAIPAAAATPFEDKDIKEEDVSVATVDALADASDRMNGETEQEIKDKKSLAELATDGFGKSDEKKEKSDDPEAKMREFFEKNEQLGIYANALMNRENKDIFVDIPDSDPKDEASKNIYDPDAADFEQYNKNEKLKEDMDRGVETFSGNCQQTVAEDGTVTYIYDSGTVVTQKPDGSFEGFDYAGRPIKQDANGVTTTEFSNGYKSVSYSDGRQEVHNDRGDYFDWHNDGSRTYHYTDGSIDEVNEDGSGTHTSATGYKVDFATDGETNNVIYYDGGGSLKLFDDKGNYITGERTLEGPNGERFTVNCSLPPGFEDKDVYEGRLTMTSEGNGKSDNFDIYTKSDENGTTITVDKREADGSTANALLSFSDTKDVVKMDFKSADGSTVNINGEGKTDENGNMNVDLTLAGRGADGSTTDLNISYSENGNSDEMSLDYSAKDADGSYSNVSAKITSDNTKDAANVDFNFDARASDGSTSVGSLTGTMYENGNGNFELSTKDKYADGSECNMTLTADTDKDGNGSMEFGMTSKKSDGSTAEMSAKADVKSGEYAKAELSGSFEDKKTGEKGTIKAISDGDNLKVSASGTDKDGKDYKFNGERDEDGVKIDASIEQERLVVNKDGSYEFEDKTTGNYVRTDKDQKVEACHVTNDETGATYDFKDGTGFLTAADGEKVLWNYDRDTRTLAIYSSDCSYTVDRKGNLYRDGEPVKVDGKWVNVIKGYNATEAPTEELTEETTKEETTEEPTTEEPTTEEPTTAKPTDPPEENDIHTYLGKWSHPGSVRTTWELKLQGDTLYLSIGGYSTDPNEKVSAPCTYEFRDGKLYVNTALFSGAAVFTYNSRNSVTVTASGETVTMTRLS